MTSKAASAQARRKSAAQASLLGPCRAFALTADKKGREIPALK
jgi:hypothetical protein